MEDKRFENQVGNWVYKGLEITEEEVRRAMANTTSNKKAAEFLEVSYPTYKKYAKAYKDLETGKSLFDIHMNQAMKGVIGRTWVGGKQRLNWENILLPNQKYSPERVQKLKANLLIHGKLEEKCYRCGFDHKRVEDNKVPLIINFKNGDKTDWRIQNIEFVCYNCSFLHCLDFFEESVVDKVETISLAVPQARQEKKEFYQLDDFYIDHIKKLGLELDDINKESVEKADKSFKSSDGLSDLIDYV